MAKSEFCVSTQPPEKRFGKHEYPCRYNISYPSGPRATPAVADGKVYALGAEGNLVCLDAIKGNVVWSKDLKLKNTRSKLRSGAFVLAPLVDGSRLFCLRRHGEGSVAVAFDKDTGKELWERPGAATEPGYSPPSIIEAGEKKQLIVWHSEAINSLNPENGNVYWSIPLKPDYGMSIMAPRKHGDYLFASGIGRRLASF